MGLRSCWSRLGERVVPGSERAVLSLAVIAFYLLGMITLIVVPLQLFVIVGKRAGTELGGVLHLSPMGGTLLILLIAATCGWSVVVGGFARAFLSKRHLDWPWLVPFGLGLLVGLTSMFDQMREAVGAFTAIHAGDNPKVSAFITFWILMVGYAGKAVWDEARDRMADRMKAFLPKEAPQRPTGCTCLDATVRE